MRDDVGGDNSDVETGKRGRKGGRERGNKDEEHKKQMERSEHGRKERMASMFMLCWRERVMHNLTYTTYYYWMSTRSPGKVTTSFDAQCYPK